MSDAKAKDGGRELKRAGELFAEWTGLLAAPTAWALQMQVGYTLVPWACAHDEQAVSLHVVTVVALLMTAGGAFVSWRVWRKTGREWPGGEGGAVGRSRFMAVLGLLTSAIFFLLILMQGVASFIVHPCQP
ncbi:MAG TPA: hypothetical protein VJT82_07540 [Pyrinomonadaceae bacterium]|nr:hypothetical protein [Pyrinomonadaceae bacterium]